MSRFNVFPLVWYLGEEFPEKSVYSAKEGNEKIDLCVFSWELKRIGKKGKNRGSKETIGDVRQTSPIKWSRHAIKRVDRDMSGWTKEGEGRILTFRVGRNGEKNSGNGNRIFLLSECDALEGFSCAKKSLTSGEVLVAAVAEWYRYRTVACFVTGSNPVPLKTRRVGQRCTLNLSRAETSSRWCGVVVRRGGASSGVVHVT
ncbi:uncharacterized protein TNCV_1692071 [Trichonephila clavipes]|nr:uncharacterized protein TNCV_1692071 [Trichonephila clavipes]